MTTTKIDLTLFAVAVDEVVAVVAAAEIVDLTFFELLRVNVV